MGRPESPKAEMLIESLGSVGGLVTGSCHVVEVKGSKLFVDLGMFQGHREERSERGERRNLTPLSEVAKGVNHVLITHTHIDHIGRVPILFAEGFKPKILATEIAAAFMGPMLRNSARIQQSQYSVGDRLYDEYDVEATLKNTRGVKPFKEIPVGQKNSNLSVEFLSNGHVEGSSSILLRNPNYQKNILFTGDMGKPNQSLCGGYNDFVDKYPKDKINVLFIESTNFEKEPVPFEEKQEELMDTFEKVWAGGGNVVLPVLSFHRYPEIREMIHNLQKSGRLPSDCKIVVDCPLGMELLDITEDIGLDYLTPRFGNDPYFYKTDEESMARFELKNLINIGSHLDSIANDSEMSKYNGKVIILASGGMGGHGRSVNYLKGEFCKNPKNAVIFTCHQVEGTQGANMLYREKNVKGKQVGAQVYKIEGFTSHISGPKETFGFIERFNLEDLQTVIIGHGKESSRVKMAEEFIRRGYKAKIFTPDIRQSIAI